MIEPAVISKAERYLKRVDPHMKRLITSHGPCALGARRRDPFHVIATSIISQQLSVRAADTIQARVEVRAGVRGKLTPRTLLALTPEDLRACGLSNAKARWLHALSEARASRRLSFPKLATLDDEAAIEVLDALPGIGRWTAEMVLIFAFDRLDIFSMGDVGLRRAINHIYHAGEKLGDAETLALSETWAPYRSVASWYLWRLVDGNLQAWV
ncbi:MAG: DNA-3-methyladenine glycosylase [Pseudomonadota bacterium]|nr:DNA-3-methyladenine glycosylase [Gammaproteobacteria bacterium]MEC9356704.1 DNA-3-methyladenine glycosylase [Pseudomonadota bacterium]